jgi:outer membrane protein assembly factor BamD
LVVRVGTFALLLVVLSGSGEARQDIYWIADQTNTDPRVVQADGESAERNIEITRFYVKKRDYAGAINRCKNIVTHFQASQHVDEALALLVESFLAVDIRSDGATVDFRKEAQTAAAVLNRKYPHSGWTHVAGEILKSAGLSADEDEASWISRAFK